MKNVFGIIIVLIVLSGCSVYKMLPSPRHIITHQMTFENMTDDEIFDKTEMWFAKTFVDSRSVLELKSREGKQLYGNAIISNRFKCTFEMYVKDNKLKCHVSNINFFVYDKYFNQNVVAYYEEAGPKTKKTTDDKISEILQDLYKFIQTPIW